MIVAEYGLDGSRTDALRASNGASELSADFALEMKYKGRRLTG